MKSETDARTWPAVLANRSFPTADPGRAVGPSRIPAAITDRGSR
jgi:hypothetical protein